MATHNPKETRDTIASTLFYIYRGDAHEHEVSQVRHIGGNVFSADPMTGGKMDLSDIIEEFEDQSALYQGKGRKLFKHYVISLAPGEHLQDDQWHQIVNDYMTDLGYSRLTVWTAAVHMDTDKEHAHIAACLVQNQPGRSLVSTANDYEKGWSSMRRAENRYGLRKLQNPNENFGYNYTKVEVKVAGGRLNAIKRDEAAIIRARFKEAYKRFGRPKTMTDLVMRLAKVNVFVAVKEGKNGKPEGIKFKTGKNGTWVSGSKVKATRFTWGKLLSNEGISYNPERDNFALGLAKDPGQFTFSFKLTAKQFKRLKTKRSPYRVRSINNNPYVDFIYKTGKEKYEIVKLKKLMEFVEFMLSLFGLESEEMEIKQAHRRMIARDYARKLDKQQCFYYEPDQLITYSEYDHYSPVSSKISRDTEIWRVESTRSQFSDCYEVLAVSNLTVL
ncbi:relaxase/mobilization nuclease domain-containing protein [Agarivorans sp. TSD2052]|uniref:relaxase/mobilization nuclease domain-containing protein n=1 Tax=Agarivorans sp. TSD2052 TaxID=2937286 RepID=UPI00200DF7EF|nr:relaxase/mobilization nuclease domain-containing protein [Agarivorans sp. TSD2052]UPW20113.1 relaxase/mobilization nuclease domain-containing protein [Agarivorans sp. TSD2052]